VAGDDTQVGWISPHTVVGEGVELGYGVVLEDGVQIGAGCVSGHYAVVHRGTRVGDNCQVGDHIVLGRAPMRAKTSTLQSGAYHRFSKTMSLLLRW
jgi:UDP-3-O-[3-hydroxymyristoyl] glucosamine N-acyltransferase